MQNYRILIESILKELSSEAILADDPNVIIDKHIGPKKSKWYPPYLAHDNTSFFIFLPFSFESFLDIKEAKEECNNSRILMRKMNKGGKRCKIFFITKNVEDSRRLGSMKLAFDYGILHGGHQPPIFQNRRLSKSKYSTRLLPGPIRYLSKCKNLRGIIGKTIRTFSIDYLKQDLSIVDEYSAVKDLIETILSCDKRFKLESRAIHFMSSMEQILNNYSKNVRDHYFHACNTMLIGFEAIDKSYDKFIKAANIYGKNIVVEFVWAITSLYHDIGYPASFQGYIISQTYDIYDESFSEEVAKKERHIIWENQYSKSARILENLYSHIVSSPNVPWVYDGFAWVSFSTPFYSSLQTSFVESGSHGCQGALKLTSFIDRIISKVKNSPDRAYLYRHIGLAAISVLFHDPSVRKNFRENGIKFLKIANFPISSLLTYVDAIQDDRRDMSGIIVRPDIFGEIIFDGNVISAKMNKRAIDESSRNKILQELKEAFEFFKKDGIEFSIPNDLIASA